MGCDIHGVIEVNKYPGRRHSHWPHAEVYLDRHYRLFGVLAGVRDDSVEPVVSPRGLPEDMSFKTRDLNEYYIADESLSGCEDRWILRSHLWPNAQIRDGHWAFDSDNHTHSWVTVPELREAIKRFEGEDGKFCVPAELRALLASMLMLDGDEEGRSRFVFWFDN
ncbi:MAG: hypothetical protein IH822_06355 [Chloroflexi bacterium]|nr:hypothetical protein [Chloroflexota bacterium]